MRRRRDAGQALLAADGGRQVLRVGGTRPVERVADGDAEAGSGQPGGQPVDRHDPAGEQDLVVALEDLEVRVVEGQLPAEPLDTPADDDLVVDLQASLDITPAEPGRLDRARLVGQGGDRPLDPAPERGLEPRTSATRTFAEITVPGSTWRRSPSRDISRRSS